MARSKPSVDNVMTISEAARQLGASRTWVVTLISQGGLVQHNIKGGVNVVETRGVEDLIKAKEARAS